MLFCLFCLSLVDKNHSNLNRSRLPKDDLMRLCWSSLNPLYAFCQENWIKISLKLWRKRNWNLCWFHKMYEVDAIKIENWGKKKFHEVVTELNEFPGPLRYCFAMRSFRSFAVVFSNIFISFFSLRRYIRSFVKSVLKWNIENIVDTVHGWDRLQT